MLERVNSDLTPSMVGDKEEAKQHLSNSKPCQEIAGNWVMNPKSGYLK
jgi:hypothetical protein